MNNSVVCNGQDELLADLRYAASHCEKLRSMFDAICYYENMGTKFVPVSAQLKAQSFPQAHDFDRFYSGKPMSDTTLIRVHWYFALMHNLTRKLFPKKYRILEDYIHAQRKTLEGYIKARTLMTASLIQYPE